MWVEIDEKTFHWCKILRLGFIDDYSAMSALYFLGNRNHVYEATRMFMLQSERSLNEKLQKPEPGIVREHKGDRTTVLGKFDEVELEFSPLQAPKSTKKVRHFLKALSMRALVVLASSDLPLLVWTKAMHYSKFLQSLLATKAMDTRIPALFWKPPTNVIDFLTPSIVSQQRLAI